MLIIIHLAQFLALAAACFGLFRLWTATQNSGRRAALIISAGFLLRLLAGLAAFWISFLNLPVAESIQLGDGLWFFASDARAYLEPAVTAVQEGPDGVLWDRPADQRPLPSPFYVWVLAVMVMLFGETASIGVLLNLFLYLGTCLLFLRIGGPEWEKAPRDFALGIVSFSPTLVLWSLQPLKDTMFFFLCVAFFFGVFHLSERFLRGNDGDRWRALLASAALLSLTMYAISSIRWYFALILLGSTSLVLGIATLVIRPRRLSSFIATPSILVLLLIAFPLGAGYYLPREILPDSPRELDDALRNLPAAIKASVAKSKGEFDRLDGGTTIREAPGTADPENEETPAPDKRSARQPQPNLAWGAIGVPAMISTQNASAPSASGGGDVEPATAAESAGRSQPAREEEKRPTSGITRIRLGIIAMFVPRSIAQELGLVSIGGGRGLWLAAEADTLFFDAALLILLAQLSTVNARLSWRDPTTWQLLITTLLIAGALGYVINNFGTLMRYRAMVLYGCCSLLVLCGRPREGYKSKEAA